MTSQQDNSLGELDFCAVQEQVQDVPSGKRSQHMQYSDVDRFDIGKYASKNGPAATVRKCSSKFTALNETAVRTFCKNDTEEVQKTEVVQYLF